MASPVLADDATDDISLGVLLEALRLEGDAAAAAIRAAAAAADAADPSEVSPALLADETPRRASAAAVRLLGSAVSLQRGSVRRQVSPNAALPHPPYPYPTHPTPAPNLLRTPHTPPPSPTAHTAPTLRLPTFPTPPPPPSPLTRRLGRRRSQGSSGC